MADSSEEEPLSIGEVIGLLTEEFPDVSVSKVRFLESQGLISPQRSDGGYRMFHRSDVERLRYILSQQRDHFLPLKVIKSKLTMWERGEAPSGPESGHGGGGVLEGGDDRLTRSELLRRSGLDESQLHALIDHGLIDELDGGLFDDIGLAVGVEARRLFANGLEARHLRTIRHSAEREADILAQLTVALRRARNPEAHEQARNILEGCGEAVLAIHRTLLAAELRLLDQT